MSNQVDFRGEKITRDKEGPLHTNKKNVQTTKIQSFRLYETRIGQQKEKQANEQWQLELQHPALSNQ